MKLSEIDAAKLRDDELAYYASFELPKIIEILQAELSRLRSLKRMPTLESCQVVEMRTQIAKRELVEVRDEIMQRQRKRSIVLRIPRSKTPVDSVIPFSPER